ncbi:hypothetical protein CFC21_050915 [Triticum aestivum]|uniref:F-box domain-containing protein n=4 Tax=Triticum TaxID=4564 RepID=A0A9R0S2L2_TRITD|nr:F-box protein At5g62510-like isoform X1 [Triticum aestivum]XP_044362182.1 F-box protein At5g62510-like isoform X1 [Triticum aestivum]KAF7041083.1 hypothetical protein CFC21_050915 [Triticum aestivum]VAH87148.1 unnamed protein product [Triticum turgidum subsp. durum]
MTRTGSSAKNKESVQTEIDMESKRSSTAAGHIADLPEQIWWAILERLPPKSVLRFRAVCKSWLNRISNNNFLEEYHGRQKPQHLIVPVDPDNTRHKMSHRVDAVDFQHPEDGFRSIISFTSFGVFEVFDPDEETAEHLMSAVQGSIGGLLLVSFEHRCYICNPGTKESRRLPQLDDHEILGLYMLGDEFRVLYLKEDEEGDAEFFVLSVHQSLSNKSIGYCPVSPAANLPEIDGPKKLGFSLQSSAIEPPAMVGANLYWAPLELWPREITVFDYQSELFHWMKLPKTKERSKSNTNNTMKVLELDGELGLSLHRRGESSVELWVLDSLKMWELKHSIQLPVADITGFGAHTWDPFLMSMDGGVIVRCVSQGQGQGGEGQQGTQALLYCNRHGELAPGPLFVGDLAAPAIHLFKQSIRRHALFQGHQQDATSPLSLFRDL